MFQLHLLRRLSFFHWIVFASLSEISWLYMSGWISVFSALFHWYICLFFHQNYPILITVALQCVSKISMVSSLTLTFPFSVYWVFWFFCLSIQTWESGCWYPQMTYWDFDWNCRKVNNQFRKNWHPNNIESSYPCVRNISPFI